MLLIFLVAFSKKTCSNEFALTGSLTSRLVSDTDKMGRSIAMNSNVLLRSLVKTCSMLVQMLSLSWQLTLLTCVEMPLLAVLQNHYSIHYQVIDLLSTYLVKDLDSNSFPMLPFNKKFF